jgi:hypothetical protein
MIHDTGQQNIKFGTVFRKWRSHFTSAIMAVAGCTYELKLLVAFHITKYLTKSTLNCIITPEKHLHRFIIPVFTQTSATGRTSLKVLLTYEHLLHKRLGAGKQNGCRNADLCNTVLPINLLIQLLLECILFFTWHAWVLSLFLKMMEYYRRGQELKFQMLGQTWLPFSRTATLA